MYFLEYYLYFWFTEMLNGLDAMKNAFEEVYLLVWNKLKKQSWLSEAREQCSGVVQLPQRLFRKPMPSNKTRKRGEMDAR